MPCADRLAKGHGAVNFAAFRGTGRRRATSVCHTRTVTIWGPGAAVEKVLARTEGTAANCSIAKLLAAEIRVDAKVV